MAKSNKSTTNWSKMVGALYKLIGIFLLLIIILIVWYDQSRSFYCLPNDKCITVWKRIGNKCYIIPDKYYGICKPSKNYIKSTNVQSLTLYFSNDIPNRLIVRNQMNSAVEKEGYEIVNNMPEEMRITEYSDEFKNILYKSNAVKFKDVKTNTDYIDLDIQANYAIDKKGNNLK